MTSDADSEPTKQVKLDRSIGLASACGFVFGIIIGTGIFITPTSVLSNSGGFPGIALIIWLVSGVTALIGAICYTELGTMIQKSGGDYIYIREAYGDLCAFLFVWMNAFMTSPCFKAVTVITISNYIIQMFYINCTPSKYLIKIFAAIILSFIGFINTRKTKFLNKLQVLLSGIKLLTFVVIIGAAFWTFFSSSSSIHKSEIFADWFPSTKHSFDYSNLAFGIYSSLFTYSGWNQLNSLTEELKNPEKNLKRAIIIGVPLVILVYLLINVSFFIVLSPNEVLASDTIALTFSDKVFPSYLSWILPVSISFSAFVSCTTAVLGISRSYYAAAREGNLPDMFATISINSYSPITCVLLIITTSTFALLIDDLKVLILYAIFSEFFFIALSISSILYLRYKRPNADRPIKVFIGFPIAFLIICIFINALTAYQNPHETLVGFIFLLCGIPVYYICIKWENKPKNWKKAIRNMNIFCQKLFMLAKED